MVKLEVSGLSFSYDNKKLFENLDFSIKEGEFVSLLGPSGCGKSTILKLLTGVIQAETGRITVDGQPVTGLSEHFAYMPQNDLLFPWKTILDNVCLLYTSRVFFLETLQQIRQQVCAEKGGASHRQMSRFNVRDILKVSVHIFFEGHKPFYTTDIIHSFLCNR